MAFLELEERSERWHEHRRKFIGGSEIAALFGEEERPEGNEDGGNDISAGYQDSVFALHYIKAGKVDPAPVRSDVVDAGILLEPFIASLIAAKRGWTLHKGRYAIDNTTPGMGASIDYEVTDAGGDAEGVSVGGNVARAFLGPLEGPGVLQIKNVSERQYYRKWAGEPPMWVLLQVQQELACTGYQWGCVGAWIGGNTLRLWFYERFEGVIAAIRQRIADFWQRVREGRPPNPDGSDSSSHVLRQLYPQMIDNEASPIDLTGDNEAHVLVAELEEHREKRLLHEKEEQDRNNRLKLKMGQSTYAVCGDRRIKISVTPPTEFMVRRGETRTLRVKHINTDRQPRKTARRT